MQIARIYAGSTLNKYDGGGQTADDVGLSQQDWDDIIDENNRLGAKLVGKYEAQANLQNIIEMICSNNRREHGQERRGES